MEFSLANITELLMPILSLLNDVKDANIIIAIGGTNTGKSTMMASLAHGPDSLKEKVMIRPKEQQEHASVKKVIDIDTFDRNHYSEFKIGHNNIETIVP